jgi:hypothetical protein
MGMRLRLSFEQKERRESVHHECVREGGIMMWGSVMRMRDVDGGVRARLTRSDVERMEVLLLGGRVRGDGVLRTCAHVDGDGEVLLAEEPMRGSTMLVEVWVRVCAQGQGGGVSQYGPHTHDTNEA